MQVFRLAKGGFLKQVSDWKNENGNGNVNFNFNLNGNGNVNDNIRPLAPSNLEGELKIENENGNFNVKKSETSVASV